MNKIIGKNNKINVKNFDSVEEFNDFYKLHEDEINNLSTVKLNKLYHIKDFKIVRRKIDNEESKSICFQQIFKTNPTNNNDEELALIKTKLKTLENDNIKIKQQLFEIINHLNNSS